MAVLLVNRRGISIGFQFQVVAVDKGAGWGEFEGKAIVYSDPLFYRSRAFREDPPPPPPPDPFVLARESIERKYPSPLCRSAHSESFKAGEKVKVFGELMLGGAGNGPFNTRGVSIAQR